MNNEKPNNTLAIIALVLGIIAILFSFIPCAGTLAIAPGVIGLILGVVAYMKAKDNGDPKGLALGAIITSAAACAIAIFQMVAIGSFAKGINADIKKYDNCEELMIDLTATRGELESLTEEIEKDDSKALGSLTKITTLGVKIGKLETQAAELGCDQMNEEGMDEGSEEGMDEGSEEGSSEGEESEIEEDGNGDEESDQ